MCDLLSLPLYHFPSTPPLLNMPHTNRPLVPIHTNGVPLIRVRIPKERLLLTRRMHNRHDREVINIIPSPANVIIRNLRPPCTSDSVLMIDR
jgi:hypothetical protein